MWRCGETYCIVSLQVCNTTTDRKHADISLEKCVTESIMNIVSGFFNSPFSDNSTSLQVTGPNTVPKHFVPIFPLCVSNKPMMFVILNLSSGQEVISDICDDHCSVIFFTHVSLSEFTKDFSLNRHLLPIELYFLSKQKNTFQICLLTVCQLLK